MKITKLPWDLVPELTETYDCWSEEEADLTNRIVEIEDEQDAKGEKIRGVLVGNKNQLKVEQVTLLFFRLKEGFTLTMRESFTHEWITIE